MKRLQKLCFSGIVLALCFGLTEAQPLRLSGIYPHLAMQNSAKECGIGAVVPWADRLWVVTYSPHKPFGSDDKLYEIDALLNVIVRPESVGGTPADRMIHRESQQLIIGPYFIDRQRNVRAISPQDMPGRLTACARHLFQPAKVYFATMEEGLYEVDVHSLKVHTIYKDANLLPEGVAGPLLPGYHGKGAYTSQKRLVYANNGEYGAMGEPPFAHKPAGCLAQWEGKAWQVVERKQFTEVTGPGGIYGAANQDEPIWAVGWDHRSLILKLLDHGQWSTFRLPKASHTYDGAHGWYTEWPRIRDVGREKLLMTMHGMFWDFPKTFATGQTGGIRPLSSYLKIIADFCPWKNEIVFGCDDSDKFRNSLNGRSHSNLWFVNPSELSQFGPAIGRGGVWLDDSVKAGTASAPYLLAGFTRRAVFVQHDAPQNVTFTFQTDAVGKGDWQEWRSINVPPDSCRYIEIPPDLSAEWIRVSTNRDVAHATVFFQYANEEPRMAEAADMFHPLASMKESEPISFGLVRVRDDSSLTLSYTAHTLSADGTVQETGYYECGADLKITKVNNPQKKAETEKLAAIDTPVYEIDDASVIITSKDGKRWRLPFGWKENVHPPKGWFARTKRCVVTERELLNCGGTFYELPLPSAGGVAKIRPICTHDRLIGDYCTWRGLLVLTGVRLDAEKSDHAYYSSNGKAGLFFCALDDLWKLGKPRGHGGVWKNSDVRAGLPSDPFLMSGFDKKSLYLANESDASVNFVLEADITGEGKWIPFQRLRVAPGQTNHYDFPPSFNAYWVRLTAASNCKATTLFTYE